MDDAQYDPYLVGSAQNTFIHNPDGSEYVGQVWPGYTVFPDWFNPNTTVWWTESLTNWTDIYGVKFDGIWLDMNEPSSFCQGSCGSNLTAEALQNTSTPFALPGTPESPVTAYPECYSSEEFGSSGNLTVNGTSTYNCAASGASPLSRRSEIWSPWADVVEKREEGEGIGAGGENITESLIDYPPYAIHNGAGTLTLSPNTVAVNASHYGGYLDYDVHNVFGFMEEIATHKALQVRFLL